MQTTINYLFALTVGVAAGYGFARLQDWLRNRRILRRIEAELRGNGNH